MKAQSSAERRPTVPSKSSEADRLRLRRQADAGWPLMYWLSDLGFLSLLAVALLIVPFEGPRSGKIIVAALVAALAVFEIALDRANKPDVQPTVVASSQALCAVICSGVAAEFWQPAAAAAVAVCITAIMIESRRRVSAIATLTLIGLVLTGLLHGSDAPTNWAITLLVGFGIVISTELWFREWDAKRSRLEERHAEMLDRARTFSWEADEATREIVGIAGNVESVLGRSADELIGQNLDAILGPDTAHGDGRTWQEGEEQHAVITTAHSDGHTVTLHEVRLPATLPGRIRGVASDMTEAAQAGEALRHQADHDALTDLFNRTAFGRAVDRTLGPTGNRLAVLLLDLDRFKEVNDTLGHPVGDQLLQVLAQRFISEFGDRATLSRIGGDEFAFCLPDVTVDEATAFAKRVCDVVAAPAQVEGFQLAASASIGVAVAPVHGTTFDELLKNADIASYAAKRAGGGSQVFESTPEGLTRQRLRLLTDMSTALDHGQFELFIQPKVNLEDTDLVSVEGLARWHHPDLGLLLPADFLHTLDVAAGHHRFTIEMIRQAIQLVAQAEQRGRSINIAVNLASMSLRDVGLPSQVRGLLEDSGVDGTSLTIEIIESDLVQNDPGPIAVINGLKQLGVEISIDDFGTGYSNFSQLKHLPADEIKIDRSFVAGLTDNPEDLVIVKAMIDLAKLLKYRVVAEGIETEEQATLLRSLGCELGQGFYFDRPMPQAAFLSALDGAVVEG